MAKYRLSRKQLVVDIRFQGTLAVRIVLYWLLCLFAIGALLLVRRALTMPIRPMNAILGELGSLYGPAAIASLFILPMVVVDVLRLTSRYAGPIFRLRRSLQALADGEAVEGLRFRGGDFWQGLACDFNTVAGRLRPSTPEADAAPVAVATPLSHAPWDDSPASALAAAAPAIA